MGIVKCLGHSTELVSRKAANLFILLTNSMQEHLLFIVNIRMLNEFPPVWTNITDYMRR